MFTNNIKIHFEHLLKQNGFLLSTTGEKKKLEKVVKGQMKELTTEITTETFKFNNFINASGDDKTKAKYKPFMDRIKILTLDSNNKEQLLQYTNEVGSEKSFRSHLNFCRLLQSDDILKGELEKKHENSYDIAQLTSTFSKIFHIRKLEEKFSIGFLNVEFEGNNDKIEFDNELAEGRGRGC